MVHTWEIGTSWSRPLARATPQLLPAATTCSPASRALVLQRRVLLVLSAYEPLGDEGLRAVLLAADGALPEAVSRSIDAFADGNPLSDDITFVAIAWIGDPPVAR